MKTPTSAPSKDRLAEESGPGEFVTAFRTGSTRSVCTYGSSLHADGSPFPLGRIHKMGRSLPAPPGAMPFPLPAYLVLSSLPALCRPPPCRRSAPHQGVVGCRRHGVGTLERVGALTSHLQAMTGDPPRNLIAARQNTMCRVAFGN
ncbi:hypothetical protein CMUS01_06962 [Colletotrichum musicola]|uniref:Uncharacterized protein n=1 Tax=Colletotrichum musicola TaxID=2175873 RepID=A0A8H6KJF0_9PEZI|nr:hypothetical protein CMUS01_06962 [Colletotrichum musicola]